MGDGGWGVGDGGVGMGGGGWGVIYNLVPSPLASNTFLHHILIFGVRPLVVFPLPPPPTKNPGWVLNCLLQGIFNNFLINQLPMV